MKNVNILKDLNTLNKLHTSSVESYTTNNGIVDFTCDNAGYVDNVAIEGKTLVNLASCDMGIRSLTESSGNIWTTSPQYGTFTNSNGLITFTTANESWIDFGSIIPVTEGTNIRFIVNIIENGGTKTNCIAMFFNDMPVTNSSGANTDKVISLNKIGTTTSLGLQDNQFKVPTGAKYALFIVSCSEPNTTYKFDNFMLLENNEDDFISYFEGLKSVGQGDKIDVLTYKRGSENLASNLTFTEGFYVNSNDGNISNSDSTEFKYSNEYIEVEGGCEYLFDNINGQFAIYDSSKNVIPLRWQNLQGDWLKGNDYQSTFVYAMPKNAKYVRINLPISNLKPYSLIKTKSDKKQISTTLRSLPNGVKDTIEKRGNKYVKVQRCEEIVLDGSSDEGWGLNQIENNTYQYTCSKNFTNAKGNDSLILTDREKCTQGSPSSLGIKFGNGNKQIYYRISSSTISSSTVETFTAWLKANPLTVVYELATPIITELPNFNPQTYKGDNTLLINSGVIQCDASFDVCKGIRSELDVIKDKVSSLDDNVVEVYKPQLLNGFENLYHEDDVYIRKCDSVVSINLRLTNKGTVSDGTLVFKLPGNFSPVSRIGSSIHNGLTGAFTGALIITNGGEVVLYNSTDLSDIRLNIVYMARC